MGMDVFHYKITKVLNQEEVNHYYQNDPYNESIVQLDVNDRLLNWMKLNGIAASAIVEVTELDWEAWHMQNPQYKDHEFISWELSPEVENKWLHLENTAGQTVLLDSGFCYQQVPYLFVEKIEIGYMRKPFRHSETPSKIANGALVLSVTNFSDKGKEGFAKLQQIDAKQTQEANVFIFKYEDLDSLKEFSYCENDFERSLMQDWEKDHFVLFNW